MENMDAQNLPNRRTLTTTSDLKLFDHILVTTSIAPVTGFNWIFKMDRSLQ